MNLCAAGCCPSTSGSSGRIRRKPQIYGTTESHDEYCEPCDKQFKDGVKFRDHINVVHYGLKKYPCVICNTHFGYRIQFIAHFKKAHKWTKPKIEAMKTRLNGQGDVEGDYVVESDDAENHDRINDETEKRNLKELIADRAKDDSSTAEEQKKMVKGQELNQSEMTETKENKVPDINGPLVDKEDQAKQLEDTQCRLETSSIDDDEEAYVMSHMLKNEKTLTKENNESNTEPKVPIKTDKKKVKKGQRKDAMSKINKSPTKQRSQRRKKTGNKTKSGCIDFKKGSETDLKAHGKSKDRVAKDKPYECGLCQKRFTSSGHLARHEKKFHSNMDSRPKEFLAKKKLEEHITKDGLDAQTDSKISSKDKCSKTNVHFETASHKALAQSKKMPFNCEACDTIFASRRNFLKHEKTSKHARLSSMAPFQKSYQCKFCDKMFSTKYGQRIHTKKKHSEEKKKSEEKPKEVISLSVTSSPHLSCDFCGKIFNSENTVKKHLESHIFES